MFFIFKFFYGAIFFLNSLIILNDQRFLSRVGLPLKPDERKYLDTNRQRIVDLLKTIRTLGRIPLLVLNIIGILYELFLG